MADRQLSMILTFSADASAAKKEIADLAKTLRSVASTQFINENTIDLNALQQGKQAAAELLGHLQKAVNVDTGKLNLATFSSSLKTSGKTLKDYKKELEACGPAGQEAFQKVATSLATAENPAKRLNKTMQGFLITLKNTARWQLSSTIVHGFMGALQTAYGYAQDLNKSLTNIQIVTGQSADQMEQFAIRANKAAKELSASTLAYTDAALIYYQQGLDDSAVEERTNTTIKMMNVTGQGAEEVSSYMTAIWNNFDNGTKSLEYYADAITALGAATASSSKEIADGLQKFAAVADTVGLSYEYATAALATVVAETRQSADVVGTSFKTIFARMQGLSLGETLDDGVDLNKYSVALQKIGVDVLDANGNLRTMNDILDALGKRWETLTEAQRVATAETVGGVRQYANFMALMNNWSEVQKNITIAATSEGTLQKQADIYANSWEGAKKRVQASLETIYNSIINDKAFINMTDTISTVLDGVGGLIKGLGGVKGILLTVANIFAMHYAKEMPKFLERIKENLFIITGQANKIGAEIQAQARETIHIDKESIEQDYDDPNASGSAQETARLEILEQISQRQQELNKNRAIYSQDEINHAEEEIAKLKDKGKEIEELGRKYDEAKVQAQKQYEAAEMLAQEGASRPNKTDIENVTKWGKEFGALKASRAPLKQISDSLEKTNSSMKVGQKQLTLYGSRLLAISKSADKFKNNKYPEELEKLNNNYKTGKITAEEYKEGLINLSNNMSDAAKNTTQLENNLRSTVRASGENAESMENLSQACQDVGSTGLLARQGLEGVRGTAEALPAPIIRTSTALMSITGTFMSFIAILNGIQRLKDVFTDEDAGAIEKIGAVVGVLTSIITGYVGIQKIATTVMKADVAAEKTSLVVKGARNIIEALRAKLTKASAKASLEKAAASKIEGAGENVAAAGTTAHGIANIFLKSTMSPVLIITLALIAAFAALSLVIMGIVALVKALSDSYNADAIAAKEAKEAAAAVAEQANEAREQADKLREAFDKYDSAVEKLNECKKGTQEWRDALKEVNNMVGDLIREFPELAGSLKISRDQFGQMIIENEEEIMQMAEQRASNLEMVSIAMNARASQKQLVSDKTDQKRRETSYYDYRYNGDSGYYVNADGTLHSGSTATEKYQEVLENAGEYVNLTIDELALLQKELNMSDAHFKSFYDDLQVLGNSTNKVAIEIDNAAKIIANQVLGDKYTDLDADAEVAGKVHEAIEVMTAERQQKRAEEIEQDIIDRDAEDNTKATDQSDTSKEIWRRYLAASGKTESQWVADRNQVRHTAMNRTYAYRDESGDEHEVSIKTMAAVIGAYESIQEMEGTAAEFANTFANMNSEAKLFTANVINSKDENDRYNTDLAINDLNIEKLQTIKDIDMSNMSQAVDTIAQELNMSSDEFEHLAEIAGMTAEDLAKSISTSANNAVSDITESFATHTSTAMQSIYNDIANNGNSIFSTLSVEAIKNYGQMLDKILQAGGENAVISFNTGLEKLLNANADSAEQITQIAQTIDWTSATGLDEFNKQLELAGIQIDKNSEEWKSFINSLSNIPIKLEPADVQTIRKTFLDLKKLAEKIQIGSIISDDDYEKLIAADKTLKSLFIQTANGYAYIGSNDLSTVVKENYRNNIEQGLNNNLTAQSGIKEAADWGWDAGTNAKYGKITASGRETIDYGKLANAVKEGSAPEWATGSFLESLANDVNAEVIAAIVGISTERLSELATTDINSLTEEQKQAYYQEVGNLYQAIAENQEQLEQYQESFTQGLTELGSSYDSYAEGLEAIRAYQGQEFVSDEQIAEAITAMTNAAVIGVQSLDELDTILNEIAQAKQNVDYNTIATALMNLASQYENCTAEVEKYQAAMRSGNTEALKVAEDQLRASILLGEAAEKYGLDANVLESQARSIQALNNDMKLNAETAAQMAIANQRMNKGIDTLSDNFEDWTKKLKTATRGSMDYAEVAAEVEGALKDLLGLSDNFELPEGFLDSKENLKLLEEAANGSQLAINKLGIQMIKGAMDITSWDQALIDAYNATAATDKTMSEFTMDMQTAFDTANAGMQAIQDNIVALTNGSMTLSQALDGVDLNEEDWIKSLNEMAVATGMSVEEMRSMLNSMGVRANVEVDYVEQRTKVPTYTEVVEPGEEVTYYDSEGQPQTRRGWKHYTVPGDPIEVEGSVPVPHISINDDDLAAHTISEKTISFSGVGGGKTGGGISHSKTTNGKKSGSSSSKEKKDKKSAEKETERYHEITALIEDYTRELDKAGKAKDRAFGPKKLKAMQAEIAAQAQLNAATEEHIREIREWLEIDKARIAAQGATFDEYGNISNYTELMQQHIDAYNAAIATYNASEQSDADKEAMEAADKAYQDFIDQLSKYEETNDLLQDKLDELIEAQQAKYDKEFEMLQYTIEFKIEADDSILSYLDYMKNKIENFNDGVHDAVEMLATLNDEAATLMDKNSTYNRAIDDTLNHYLSNQGMEESDIQAFIDRFKANNMSESDMSMLEDMTEAEYQYLLELKDNLLEINNSLIENMNAVVETVQNSFSKTAEDLDKATRPIERAASALENYAAIIDIVGRDALGITDAIAAELDNAAVAVAHSATVAAKAKVDTLQSERDEVQRLYDEAMAQGLTEMAYKWKTVLEEMDDEIASATDDFNSKWQEELTKAREAFENTVERIKQSMLDAFAGSIGSWSGLKDSLEYAKTAADRFVPQYKEIYELSKLNRDIMKSIDNTSNIKNKQALRDLQKEINELEQHSGEISQYDLDNARRRYELELARLALEEARDAKSTVRLSKDAEGNWSYVYTANQEDVEKAEQNYEDKLYAMQQANNEYINSLSDQILELEEQYAEKLAEIRLDNTMSEEERNAAIERLNAYFAEQMEYLTNEGQKAVDNNARLFEEEWTTYHNWTDAFGNDVQARIDSQHDFMTQFGDTILGTYTGYGNFDELNAAMVQIAEEASAKMEEAYGALQAQVATAMEAAGIDVAHFGEVVHDTVNDQIVPSAQAAEDAVVEMGKAAVDEFKELTDGVSTWQTKYATEMQKIINKNEQLATSVNNLATAYANLVAQIYAAADAPAPKVPKFNNSNADGYTGTNTGGPGESNNDPDDIEPYTDSAHWQSDNHEHWKVRTYKSGRTEKINKGHHRWYLCDPVMTSGHGHSPIAFESAYCAVCGKKISIDPQQPYAYVDGTGDNQEVLIPGYDTGGYTGNWNSSQGKLAVLHEKELVLNKDDTKNILGTVEMVRKLSQKIDLNAQTARYAFNYHPIINDPKPIDRELQVDQTVSITAEFPNVQNRTEIEEAFTTLINQASQFANRKS